MKNIKGVFRGLEKLLRQSSWFDDGWETYNRGEYMQLYKDSWHNHRQGGVHFETSIEANEIRRKEFSICVHAEEDCPSRDAFMAELVRLEGARMGTWKGYKTVGTGYVVCLRKMPLNFKNLEQRVFQEFNRLRQLEAGIEEALHRVTTTT